MKTSLRRRWLSLALALVLALALAPGALAAEPEIRLTANGSTFTDKLPDQDPGVTVPLTAALANVTDTNAVNSATFVWSSDNTSVADVAYTGDGKSAQLRTASPGVANITVRESRNAAPQVRFTVTVSGIAIVTPSIDITENEARKLVDGTANPSGTCDFIRYGAAAPESGGGVVTASISSAKPNFVRATGSSWDGLTVDGIQEGVAIVTIRATVGGVSYTGDITVNVASNQADNLYASASASDPLRLATLEGQIAAQCSAIIPDGKLQSVSGLSVETNQGTLYLDYRSPDNPGSGVGSSLTYYASGEPRGPYLSDITFVPNASYTGEKAYITFTGSTQTGRTFKGRIVVTLEEANTDVPITSAPESPTQLSGTLFSSVCQEKTGSPLSYVTFTLPPASQGALYEGYVDANNYTAKVGPTTQYRPADLSRVSFVPAPGFVGTVRISYTGYSVSGGRFTGELVITISQGLDDGLVYNDNNLGYIALSAEDFAAFCANATGGQLDYVSFTLPPSSQGTLYEYWREGRVNTPASSRTLYYYRSEPRISSLTFVAASGFSGQVRIPFSGRNQRGIPFTGTLELHFQTTGAGDINYVCAPGSSVKLLNADFNALCQQMTGQRLHYIAFQSLPELTAGSLYHGRTSSGSMGTHVSREAKYYNNTTPYIANLSFWASSTFRGSAEIPFTGWSINGQSFNGLLVITSSQDAAGGSNSSYGGSTANQGATVSYTTTAQEAVLLSSVDFDTASRTVTNSALHYVRFTAPSSGEGILYFDYALADPPVPVSATDSLYSGGEVSLSRVSFLPAYGFSGVARIPFTAWSISGTQFEGTLEVTVREAATAGGIVRYATASKPVTFSAVDLLDSAGGRQPVSIRLNRLPDETAGKLYYQYVTPTQYSWMANTTTEYGLSDDPLASNLTFIPKAGFQGTVTIPYTAVCEDGTQYSSQILISVRAPSSSDHFRDLQGYSQEVLAAVDYLYSQSVVNGMSPGEFGPNLPIRRCDFCVMLYRAYQFLPGGAVPSFRDVPDTAYYAKAVDVLRSVGIINGTGENWFQPTATISRQDAALMVQRTLQAAGLSAADGSPSLLIPYRDGGDVAGYAQGAVACLIGRNLLPTANSTLAPRAALTRADMAVLLHRAMTTQ